MAHYTEADFEGGRMDEGVLHASLLSAGLPVISCSAERTPGGGFRLEVAFSSALDSPQEEAVLAGVISAHGLRVARREKRDAIDSRTQELIARGFAHAGQTFSLSHNAQRYWSNLLNVPASAYPLRVNTLDDEDAHDIADPAEAQAVYGAALTAVKDCLASGTVLKDRVRAAATVAEVDAVTDDR